MFELLVPMTKEQHDRLEGDQHLYDMHLRPSLMIAAIKELQGLGVEPDVWKIEGLDRREDAAAVAAACRHDGRDKVGCILLGRGSNEAGIVALAAGGRATARLYRLCRRPHLVLGRRSRGSATRRSRATRRSAMIADNYLKWVNTFEEARKG